MLFQMALTEQDLLKVQAVLRDYRLELRAGKIIDPATRSFAAHDADGVRLFSAGETFTHRALPGFAVVVASVFEETKPKRA